MKIHWKYKPLFRTNTILRKPLLDAAQQNISEVQLGWATGVTAVSAGGSE